MDTRAQGVETSVFGSLGVCRAHSFWRPLLLSACYLGYLPLCMVQVYGIFKFKKKYLISFSVLKQSCNFNAVCLNTGSESKGFSRTVPTRLPLNLPPPPPEKFLPLYITITRQKRLGRFFSQLKMKKIVSQVYLTVLANNSHFHLFHGNGARSDRLVNLLIHLFDRIINILLYDLHLFYTL